MGAESGSCGRGVWLDREALVEETLVVNLLQKIPEGLDVSVVIGDVRVVHVHPVADALSERHPLLCIFHHLGAAGPVVFLHTDLVSDVFLRDAELLLHAQLDRQSVGVPACAAVHLEAGLSLVSADGVLDRAGHYVMDSRHAVGGWRTLEENEFRRTFPHLEGFLESAVLLPSFKHLIAGADQIKTLVLFECHIFCLILRFGTQFRV